jgi:hypothetical protein
MLLQLKALKIIRTKAALLWSQSVGKIDPASVWKMVNILVP